MDALQRCDQCQVPSHGGSVSVFAGTPGEAGLANGEASGARFNYPTDVCFDARGNMYVADKGNQCIRCVVDGEVKTVVPWGRGKGRRPLARGVAYPTHVRCHPTLNLVALCER